MSAALQSPMKFNPLGKTATRKVSANAAHGLSRSPTHARPRRVNRNTLDQVRMPEDQWVPVKETILVRSEFLNEEPNKEDNSLDRFSNNSANCLWKTLQDIDEEGSAANRWTRGEWLNGSFIVGLCGLLTAMGPSAQAVAAEGEAAAAAAGGPSLSVEEVLFLLGPVFIYATFTIYRKSNPRADIQTYLLGLVSFAIFANILSVAVFKIKLF